MFRASLLLLLGRAAGLKVFVGEQVDCVGEEAATGKLCSDLTTDECGSSYVLEQGEYIQCGVAGGATVNSQCLTVGPACAKPKGSLPPAGLEFYFGSSKPSGVPAASVLDEAKSYGSQKANGMDYGWLCNGAPLTGYDFAGGRRNPPRSTYGLNHFDRHNKCKSGSTYLPVTWKLNIPDGRYKVEVVFPESTTPDCQVQGVKVCGARGPCNYAKTIDVTGGLQVTGYGHDSWKCHSLAKVTVTKP